MRVFLAKSVFGLLGSTDHLFTYGFYMRSIFYAALLGLCAFPVAVSAEEPVRAAYTSILTQPETVSGVLYDVDAEFSARVGRAIATPFSIIVPKSPGEGPQFVARVQDTPEHGLAIFTFSTPDAELIETISWAEAKVPMGKMKLRLSHFAAILNSETLPWLLQQFPDSQRTGIRPIRVGGYQAVELLGTYTHPIHGPIRFRLVGVPHPDKEASLVALSQVALDKIGLTSVDDLPRSLTGRLLTSLKFLD